MNFDDCTECAHDCLVDAQNIIEHNDPIHGALLLHIEYIKELIFNLSRKVDVWKMKTKEEVQSKIYELQRLKQEFETDGKKPNFLIGAIYYLTWVLS